MALASRNPAPGASAQTGREHTVRPGDTVYGLARAWNVTPEAVMKANNLSDGALSIGQTLVIPGTGPKTAHPSAQTAKAPVKPAPAAKSPAKIPQALAYKVQPGDTVWGIARKFDVDPAALMRDNKLTRDSTLRPGDTMRVIPNQL
jgi:membrane-bound lytic murein transglycosylase D